MVTFLTLCALFSVYTRVHFGVEGLGACDKNDFFYGSICKKTCTAVNLGKLKSAKAKYEAIYESADSFFGKVRVKSGKKAFNLRKKLYNMFFQFEQSAKKCKKNVLLALDNRNLTLNFYDIKNIYTVDGHSYTDCKMKSNVVYQMRKTTIPAKKLDMGYLKSSDEFLMSMDGLLNIEYKDLPFTLAEAKMCFESAVLSYRKVTTPKDLIWDYSKCRSYTKCGMKPDWKEIPFTTTTTTTTTTSSTTTTTTTPEPCCAQIQVELDGSYNDTYVAELISGRYSIIEGTSVHGQIAYQHETQDSFLYYHSDFDNWHFSEQLGAGWAAAYSRKGNETCPAKTHRWFIYNDDQDVVNVGDDLSISCGWDQTTAWPTDTTWSTGSETSTDTTTYSWSMTASRTTPTTTKEDDCDECCESMSLQVSGYYKDTDCGQKLSGYYVQTTIHNDLPAYKKKNSTDTSAVDVAGNDIFFYFCNATKKWHLSDSIGSSMAYGYHGAQTDCPEKLSTMDWYIYDYDTQRFNTTTISSDCNDTTTTKQTTTKQTTEPEEDCCCDTVLVWVNGQYENHNWFPDTKGLYRQTGQKCNGHSSYQHISGADIYLYHSSGPYWYISPANCANSAWQYNTNDMECPTQLNEDDWFIFDYDQFGWKSCNMDVDCDDGGPTTTDAVTTTPTTKEPEDDCCCDKMEIVMSGEFADQWEYPDLVGNYTKNGQHNGKASYEHADGVFVIYWIPGSGWYIGMALGDPSASLYHADTQECPQNLADADWKCWDNENWVLTNVATDCSQ
jgi:hypothetical protein